MLSKNSASSRAIPVTKMLDMVVNLPYIPSKWGLNKAGMQSTVFADEETSKAAALDWEECRDWCVTSARKLLDKNIHKQWTNRLLETFMWHTVLITGTDWWNFFHLRNNPQAHPDIQKSAELMQTLYETNKPWKLNYGEWHMPLMPDLDAMCDMHVMDKVKISIGRCARVSYLTHDGVRDLRKDVELHDQLLKSGHMSPFEHVARPMTPLERNLFKRPVVVPTNDNSEMPWRIDNARNTYYLGNLNGWVAARKLIVGEEDILGHRNR
jgi:hypothetical protein